MNEEIKNAINGLYSELMNIETPEDIEEVRREWIDSLTEGNLSERIIDLCNDIVNIAIKRKMEGNDAGPYVLIPVLEVPQMSDEEWQQRAAEQAVKHFTARHGVAPETVQEALNEERAYIESLCAV